MRVSVAGSYFVLMRYEVTHLICAAASTAGLGKEFRDHKYD